MSRVVRYESGICLLENEPKPLDPAAYSWYAGKGVTERTGEKNLLGRSKIPGSFVVTDSSNPYMDYKLLVNNGRNVYHHDVYVFSDNSCVVDQSSFNDLPSAVQYYKKHKINEVYLYEEPPPPPPPPPTPEAPRPDDKISTDIGPPPRVLSIEEQGESNKGKGKKSVSFKPSGSSKKVTKKRPSACPPVAAINISHGTTSNLDLGSLTTILNGTAISPGLSSFETFKPHAQGKQPSKQRSGTPIKLSQKNKVTGNKATLSGQKLQPASRIPKPTIQFTTKTTQAKPKGKIPAESQLDLSALTSIDDAKPSTGDTKPDEESVADSHTIASSKKVAPPVPPRRSSLSAASYSTGSLEDYANELGGSEPQDKTEDSTDTPDDDLKKETNSKANASPKAEATDKGKHKPSLQRGVVLARSAKPHVLKKSPAYNPIQISQLPKQESLESVEKDGSVVVKCLSKDSELEEVYKKITKFSWNSNEFSDHVAAPPSNNE